MNLKTEIELQALFDKALKQAVGTGISYSGKDEDIAIRVGSCIATFVSSLGAKTPSLYTTDSWACYEQTADGFLIYGNLQVLDFPNVIEHVLVPCIQVICGEDLILLVDSSQGGDVNISSVFPNGDLELNVFKCLLSTGISQKYVNHLNSTHFSDDTGGKKEKA